MTGLLDLLRARWHKVRFLQSSKQRSKHCDVNSIDKILTDNQTKAVNGPEQSLEKSQMCGGGRTPMTTTNLNAHMAN